MVLADRRQTDAAVLLGVLLPADPKHADVEQAHGHREHALAGRLIVRAESPDHAAGGAAGSDSREAHHPLELLAVAALAPARVVQVLPAAGGVDAGGLKVAERVRAQPHVLPRRRHGELADPIEDCLGLDRAAVLVLVAEAPAPAGPAASRVRSSQSAAAVRRRFAGAGRVRVAAFLAADVASAICLLGLVWAEATCYPRSRASTPLARRPAGGATSADKRV